MDYSDFRDANGSPVKTFDIKIEDDGKGNTVLHLPGGEQVTILGLSASTAAKTDILHSMGVPCFAVGTRILT